MAKRGRKPAKRADVAVVPAGEWVAPGYLSDAARAEFDRVVGVLRRLGTLDQADVRVVEAYAVNWDVLAQAAQAIREEGLMVAGRFGTKEPHPALAAVNSATMRLKALANDLRLTPASSKHAGKAADGPSGWEGLLSVTG